MSKRKPIKLDHGLFWDTDFKQIDFDRNKRFVIGRVLEQGDVKDYQAIKDYYGEDTIRQEASQLRYLDPKSLNFWSLIFNIPKHKFLAYKTSATQAQSPFSSLLDRRPHASHAKTSIMGRS